MTNSVTVKGKECPICGADCYNVEMHIADKHDSSKIIREDKRNKPKMVVYKNVE